MKLYGHSPKKKYSQALKLCMQATIGFEGDDYEKVIRGKLGFENADDLFKFRSAIDLCEDTDSAMSNYFRYRLHSRDDDAYSEKYLRLYGVLNAVFLQRSAIYSIAEMTKFPFVKAIKNVFNSHKVIQIRNISAAHTLNHSVRKNSEHSGYEKYTEHYKLTFGDLRPDASSITIVGGSTGVEMINLHALILDFTRLADGYCGEIALHFLDKVYENDVDIFEVKEEIRAELGKVFDYDAQR